MLVPPASPDVPALCWNLTRTYFPFLKERAKEHDGSHKSMPRHLFAFCLEKQLFTLYSPVCTSSDTRSVSVMWPYRRLMLAALNIFITISVVGVLSACREGWVELRIWSGHSWETWRELRCVTVVGCKLLIVSGPWFSLWETHKGAGEESKGCEINVPEGVYVSLWSQNLVHFHRIASRKKGPS